MRSVVRSETFTRWIEDLRDTRARAKVLVRIDRLAQGNPGDVEPVGGGISEMRIQYGPGYRVYYQVRDELLVLLLVGGDKSTQQRDIARAKEIANQWSE